MNLHLLLRAIKDVFCLFAVAFHSSRRKKLWFQEILWLVGTYRALSRGSMLALRLSVLAPQNAPYLHNTNTERDQPEFFPAGTLQEELQR